MKAPWEMPAAEFNRWFDKRLLRKARAQRRYERMVRRRRWRCGISAVVGAFFLTFALAGLVSELVGGYWGPFDASESR